ncbi:hypothetical protein [Sphingobium sp.]|uniref:hypothetical protein n=1 Tax=Sphingobium sp. TaxID=1912891 RepID=UPI002C259319|nr:hypothetical protein [Sphingobium sp.]HUD90092.1 hypothetical protein [Sphingobium sp.]
MTVAGFTSARRFATAVEGEIGYLALYGLKTDDPQAALAVLEARSGTAGIPFSFGLDMNGISAVLYEAIGPEQLAADQKASQG